MRTLKTMTCLSLLALLGACGTPDQGHYDANGNYVPPGNPTPAQRIHTPDSGSASNEQYYSDNNYAPRPRTYETTTTTYDDEGHPVMHDYVWEGSYSIPRDMLPPRGMCRVWFPERSPQDQPRIESCAGIRDRAPAGTYIISRQ